MSLVSSRILFCEGHEGSLDLQLLNRLQPGPGVELIPYGSKYDLTSFVRGRIQKPPGPMGSPGARGARYMILRDRDFDHEPVGAPALIPIPNGTHAGRVFAWFRHEVESYLVEPAALDRYFREAESADRPLPRLGEIQSALDRAATQLLAYQAARWTLGSLNRALSAAERRGLATTWAEPYDTLPEDLSEPVCLSRLQELVRDAQRPLPKGSPDDVRATFASYLARFTAAPFRNQREYLIWFSGKNLLSLLFHELVPGGAGSHHFQRYRSQAPQIIAELSPLPPDLLELQQRLTAL